MAKQGFKVMDCDIHCMEPRDLWARSMEPEFIKDAPRPPDAGNPGRMQVLGKPIPAHIEETERSQDFDLRYELAAERYKKLGRVPIEREGESPNRMLEAMDTEGIDAAVVFRTTTAHVTGLDEMDSRLADAICRTFNNWLKEFCETDRKRLIPTAQLALHDVKLAVREANRAIKENGAAALVLPSNPVKGRPFYDSYYDPLWATAQELNVPVAFHGIQLAYQEHLGNRYRDNFALVHSVAHPVELQLALGAMLTGGVFERFPKLQAAFLEGHCSWVPSWLYVLDERWEKFGNRKRYGMELLPSEYFKRQCYVSVDPDEELVVPTVAAIGDDNIVISSDWPHSDSSYPQAINTFLGIKGLSDESRRKILWDNCARLYNMN